MHKEKPTHWRYTFLSRSIQALSLVFRSFHHSLLLSLSIIFSICLFIYFSLNQSTSLQFSSLSFSSYLFQSSLTFPTSPFKSHSLLPITLHPYSSLSVPACWVEVWSGNYSIKSETHRTRGSQPHKSPLAQPTASSRDCVWVCCWCTHGWGWTYMFICIWHNIVNLLKCIFLQACLFLSRALCPCLCMSMNV